MVRFPSLLFTALACLTAGAASAADPRLPVLPPAPDLPAMQASNWTGLHLGLQAGYVWGRTRLSGIPGLRDGDAGAALGGAHLGFDYQIGGVVIGVEADIDALSHGSRIDGAGFSSRIQQDWQGSVRARLGLAFDRLLVYATGGTAFTEFERRGFSTLTGLAETGSISRTGWTAGAGVNLAVTDHVVLGMEYRYTDYGSARFGPSFVLPGFAGETETRSHAARASAAYKF